MTKIELSELLHTLGIPVNEGITSKGNENKYPRIVYWPYVEQDDMASGEDYINLVTYQISFYSRTPQHEKYRKLRNLLREKGLHPIFYHEYVEDDPVFSRVWHTYFSLDVEEQFEG